MQIFSLISVVLSPLRANREKYTSLAVRKCHYSLGQRGTQRFYLGVIGSDLPLLSLQKDYGLSKLSATQRKEEPGLFQVWDLHACELLLAPCQIHAFNSVFFLMMQKNSANEACSEC